MNLFGEQLEDNGAIFSECRKYRYVLWRIWDESKPMAMVIGLNPSTANENKNDNTITKVCKVAKFNGFGGIYMLNLFSIISSDPSVLQNGEDAIKDNDKYLREYSNKSGAVIYCWGNFKEAKERCVQIKHLVLRNPLCFLQNKNGSPKHPLYCKDETILIPFL